MSSPANHGMSEERIAELAVKYNMYRFCNDRDIPAHNVLQNVINFAREILEESKALTANEKDR